MSQRLFYKSELMDTTEREEGWYHDNEDLEAIKFSERDPHANLMSSECNDGQHMPVIDIDIPGAIELVQSTTKGHCHLLINVPMSFDHHMELLEMLADVGLVERGYVDASVARGMSLVRTPWSPKIIHQDPF